MNHNRYNPLGSPRERSPQVYSPNGRRHRVASPHNSPRQKHEAAPFRREDYFVQELRQGNHSPLSKYGPGSVMSGDNGRLKSLINEVLNSADTVAKELLSYDSSGAERLCSAYYLSRQKLTTFLRADKNQLWEAVSSKMSKKYTERIERYRDSASEEGASEFAPNNLARLEDIVYGKVIPILKTDFDHEFKKDKLKRPKQHRQTETHEGMMLLQRLQDRRSTADVDGYVDVLQKFVRRVMDKEEVLMNKLLKLQDKLEHQMEKSAKGPKQKRRHENRHQQRQEEHSKIGVYIDFVKQIRLLVRDNEVSRPSSDDSLKVELDILATKVKGLISGTESSQKSQCSHKSQKNVHTHCREQLSKGQDQIKKFKELVKKLDRQIEQLKQQGETLQQKLFETRQKNSKTQQKSSKLLKQNDDLNTKIDELSKDISYQDHLIRQHLQTIDKLQENIKIKEQNYDLLEIENERHVDNINKKNENHLRLLQHVQDIQDRIKELEEGQERKDRELQQSLQSLHVKEFQATQLSCDNDKIIKQVEKLKKDVEEKESQLIRLGGSPKEMEQFLKASTMSQKAKEERRTEDKSAQTDNCQQNTFNIPQQSESNEPFRPKYQPLNRQLGASLHSKFNPMPNPFNVPQYLTQSVKKGQESSPQGSPKKAQQVLQTNILQNLPQNLPEHLNQCHPQQVHHNIQSSQQNIHQTNKNNLQQNQQQNWMLPNIQQSGSQGINHNMYPGLQHNPSHQPNHTQHFVPNPFNATPTGLANTAHFGSPISPKKEEDSKKQVEKPDNPKKEEPQPPEQDVQVLHQTIKMMQFGLKNAQEQIDSLKKSNSILLKHNQQMFQANLPNYLKGYTESIASYGLAAVPVDNYKFHEEHEDIERHQRPDFIPSRTNKDIIEGLMKYEHDTHSLEDQINDLKKKEEEENEEKKRRSDWDAGHKGPLDHDFDSTEENPQRNQSPQQRPEQEMLTPEQEKFVAQKETIQGVQIPKLVEQLSQQKEPDIEELKKQIDDNMEERKRCPIIDLQSDQSLEKKQKQFIIIQQNANIQKIQQNANIQKMSSNESDPQQIISEGTEIPEAVLENYKIKELMDLTQAIKNRLAQFDHDQNQLARNISLLAGDLQTICSLLEVCKKTTTKRWLKYMKVETQKKQIEEECQVLQNKLDAANQLFSNITLNNSGDGPDLTFQEQIQEIMRNRANQYPIQRRSTDQIFSLRPSSQREANEIGTQTEVNGSMFFQSSVRRFIPEFRRMMTNQSGLNSALNRSFIEELQQLAVDKQPPSQRIQKISSLVSEEPYISRTLLEKLNASDDGNYEDLKRSRVRLQSQVRRLDSWLQYRKEDIVNLHDMLIRKNSLSQERVDFSQPISPIRFHTEQRDKYINQITGAPKKPEKEQSEPEDNRGEQMQMARIDELKDMYRGRQIQFSCLIVEKQQEINRLKAIMEKLSEDRLNQVMQSSRSSIRQSRPKQVPNRQIEELRGRFGDLQLSFEKQKTENQRLRLEIKEAELDKELTKIKLKEEYQLKINSLKEVPPAKEDPQACFSIRIEEPVNNYQTPSDRPQASQNDEIQQTKALQQNEKQIQAQSQSNVKKEGEAANVPAEHKSEIQPEDPKKALTPDKEKRFQRKSEIFSREPSPRSASNLDTNWKELVPQFFGKKDQKRKKKK